jgi:hypothetical protein
MEPYGPIHPERPLRRAAVAIGLSLGVHAVALALLVAWALAVLAAARKAEAERPKEVSLATLDPVQWEANRRFVAPPRPPERLRASELPAKGTPGQRPVEGKDERPLPGSSPKGWAPVEGADAPAPTLDPGAPSPVGPTLDLRPRPPAARPLVMTFTPVGEGGLPAGEGTTFMNLTVAHPEAWRFEVFFNRSVEHMDSVWRYELGAPVPDSLWELIRTRRARGACSQTSVRLDRGGALLEARVRKSSGIPELDEIILQTIRRTAPYVNLPQGILDETGIYSDTWGLCIGLRS